jgi:hypothetical protein
MQRSTEQRMGMADDCCVGRGLGARVEQGFEASRRTFEEKRPDGRVLGDHSFQIT